MDNLPGRVSAVIDLSAIEKNLDTMCRNLGTAASVCAVIKTNGYGHGALPIAQRLEKRSDIWGFAVAAVQEAAQLRDGGITKPILILGYVFPEDDEYLLTHQIRPALFTLEMAQRLSEKACRLHTEAVVHLAVDTGMCRIGLPAGELSVQTALTIAQMPGIRIEGMFTHFARADEADKTNALAAYERFSAFIGSLEKSGLQVPILHCANSAAFMEMPGVHLHMVRAGISMYGIYPSAEMDRQAERLIPAMELKSHISFVKDVPAGVPISYGGTYTTGRPSRIATIPVGYGDGYPRSLSNKGAVLIRGQRAPICGRVCMDQMMVDVTDIPEAAQFDEVTLMGADGSDELSIDELSELSGRFPYEFVCDISARVPRVYQG